MRTYVIRFRVRIAIEMAIYREFSVNLFKYHGNSRQIACQRIEWIKRPVWFIALLFRPFFFLHLFICNKKLSTDLIARKKSVRSEMKKIDREKKSGNQYPRA